MSTAEYDVPLELMRFFTGFGVRKFNYNKVKGQDWVDSVLYKMEVTPLAENWKEAWIGAYRQLGCQDIVVVETEVLS
ncbi:PNGase F N-terminal domain-containing protein [Phocaeicola vulgatus]|uniref:PNGase F N-terminal domain-containing protein n=1 Tax=Phocaeicola vulgatus TaxID=821 RepID=UPI0021657698|nr:hypothetical protein [Phocaeicola vulgatus]